MEVILMRPNRLRDLLKTDQPTIGTRVHSTWPSIVEVIGHTGMFDYVEFVAEYAPFDLYALDNFCRAVELFDMSAMIKIDQSPQQFYAQRAIGSGFQSVLFVDCRSAEDARACVCAVRPETPGSDGFHGVGVRRFAYMASAGTAEYVKALNDVVIALMIEKKSAVDRLEDILEVDGIDMIQWGPADYSMSIGRPGAYRQREDPEIKAVERRVIETALKMGVPPRAEINSVGQAKYYLDLGVRHFNIGTDISILYNWWRESGDSLRKAIVDT
jgi:2-keto-3-deoxy-L-rhamnonate aldolase RhmA